MAQKHSIHLHLLVCNVRNWRNINQAGELIGIRRPGRFDLERMLRTLSSYIAQPTAFIRSSVLADVGYLAEDLDYSMDYELWLRIGMQYPLRYIDDIWASVRLHSAAKTIASKRSIWEQKIRVYQLIESSPNLPEQIRRATPALYGAYHFKIALVCIRELDFTSGWRHFRTALMLRPRLILEWRNWQALAYTLMRLVRSGRQVHEWSTHSDP